MSTSSVMDTSLRMRRRHRSWLEALKREIVAASFAPGASVSIVARQYDVNRNQVFAWRKLYGEYGHALPASRTDRGDAGSVGRLSGALFI